MNKIQKVEMKFNLINFISTFISCLLKDYMYLRAQNKNKLIQDL